MKVVIRVDASVNIGSGHVMRCLTLADALKKVGFDISFAMRPQPGDLCDFVETRGFEVVDMSIPHNWSEPDDSSDYEAWLQMSEEDDAQNFIELIREVDIVIVDHYGINLGWEKRIKSELNCNLMAVDDLLRPHDADLVLDQNLGRTSKDYVNKVPKGCVILAGTQFALLNERFAILHKGALQRSNPASMKEQKLLISMGGIDKPNSTLKILQALSRRAEKINTTVLLSKNSPNYDSVSSFCANNKGWVNHIPFTNDMASLMLEHTLAIGAPGATSWERACMGLPSIVVPLAENQRDIGKSLSQHAATLTLEVDELPDQLNKKLHSLISCSSTMRQSNFNICDGWGSYRVSKIMLQLTKYQAPVFLRKATSQDIRTVFTWQCLPEVRAYSLNKNPPKWGEHKEWMSNKLQRTDDYFYIVEANVTSGAFEPVGSVRLDVSESDDNLFIISIYLDPSVHGQGIGLEALKIVSDMHRDKRIYAKVLKDNHASQRLFTKAGFRKISEEAFIRE